MKEEREGGKGREAFSNYVKSMGFSIRSTTHKLFTLWEIT